MVYCAQLYGTCLYNKRKTQNFVQNITVCKGSSKIKPFNKLQYSIHIKPLVVYSVFSLFCFYKCAPLQVGISYIQYTFIYNGTLSWPVPSPEAKGGGLGVGLASPPHKNLNPQQKHQQIYNAVKGHTSVNVQVSKTLNSQIIIIEHIEDHRSTLAHWKTVFFTLFGEYS